MRRMPFPLVPAPRTLVALLAAVASLLASTASADVEYSYSEPFEVQQGCPVGAVLEVAVVFEEAIPPDTPLPLIGDSNPGIVSWRFSACGETCASGAPCGAPGSGVQTSSFRFATDSSGDVAFWEVNVSHSPQTTDVTFSTTRRLDGGNLIQGDLFTIVSTGVAGGSTSVGAWSSDEIGGAAVPASRFAARVILAALLMAAGGVTLMGRNRQLEP